MKKVITIILILSLTSCSYFAPETSKALTEEDQLKEMQRHNSKVEKLMEEQNDILRKSCKCK